MPKINKGYQSLFEYFVVKDYPFARWLDERLYSDENSRLKYLSNAPYGRRWNPNPHRGQQILGGLQPIADMGKDFIDTFKPYKAGYHVKRDFLQPLRGVGNIAKGVANLICVSPLFLGNTVRYAFISGSVANFASNMRLNFERTASWLLDGVSSLIRGVTQVVATPLTWLIKMPLRGLITAIKGAPQITQNHGMQCLVADGKNAVQEGEVIHLDCVRHELHRKFKKAINRGQKTNIPSKQEEELFNRQYFKYGRSYEYPLREDRAIAALQYIGLFSKDIAEQQQSLQAKPVKSCGWTSVEAYNEDEAATALRRGN